MRTVMAMFKKTGRDDLSSTTWHIALERKGKESIWSTARLRWAAKFKS